MANPKRKRNQDGLDEDAATEEGSNTSGPGEVDEAKQMFNVSVIKGSIVPKSKRRKTSNWTDILYEDDFPGGRVSYIINPGQEWQSLRKYKNFVVQDKTFGTGDYVLVKPTQDITNVDDLGWVGRVLEIRARDATAVFVRIFWLYWQSELPMGPQPYHAEQELIMSNFMQIIDAQTVDGMVEITHVKEDEREAKPADGYFYRQTLDVSTNKLSRLRKDCKCDRYHNPDTLLLQCTACQKWQHEPCVVAEILRQRWQQLESPNGVNGSASTPDDATTSSTPLRTPASVHDTITISPRHPGRGAEAATPKKRAKKGKGLKYTLTKASTPAKKQTRHGSQDIPSEPWDNILEGLLERVESTPAAAAADNGTSNSTSTSNAAGSSASSTNGKGSAAEAQAEAVTGKVVVTDKRDKSGSRVLIDARCLFCDALLRDTEEEDEDEDEEDKNEIVEEEEEGEEQVDKDEKNKSSKKKKLVKKEDLGKASSNRDKAISLDKSPLENGHIVVDKVLGLLSGGKDEDRKEDEI